VFSDPSRYDSPPSSVGNIQSIMGEYIKKKIGVGNGNEGVQSVSTEGGEGGSYVVLTGEGSVSAGDSMSFGADSLSPYDILTQYTNRRSSHTGHNGHSGGNNGDRVRSLGGMSPSHLHRESSNRNSLRTNGVGGEGKGNGTGGGGIAIAGGVNDNFRRGAVMDGLMARELGANILNDVNVIKSSSFGK